MSTPDDAFAFKWNRASLFIQTSNLNYIAFLKEKKRIMEMIFDSTNTEIHMLRFSYDANIESCLMSI